MRSARTKMRCSLSAPVERASEGVAADSSFAKHQGKIRFHHYKQGLFGTWRGLGGGRREIDIDVDGGEWCGYHEDDQENENDIYEWRYIDLMCFTDRILLKRKPNSYVRSHRRLAYRDDRGIFVAGKSLTVEIARQVTKNFGCRIPEHRAIAGDGAGETIIHHDRWNGRD